MATGAKVFAPVIVELLAASQPVARLGARRIW